MGYQASYRRYRPQDFDQLVGQKHVVTTLQNSLLAGQVAHAYLFTGPRGTGKTSVARILAKAINCEHAPTANPCNQCESCLAVNNGTSLDVIEIDAASNRGIDDIRDLREKVSLAPAGNRKKIYIIDEVHMLTAEAFNALLKTLEEPPAHVVFILATTEPQKVPLTIASRCQRFDFHRLDVSEITPRLMAVAQAADCRLTPDAAALIAQRADGALRDALSLLDQCLVFGGHAVTASVVQNVLGSLRREEMEQAAAAMLRRDVKGLLQWLQGLFDAGRDPAQVAQDMSEYFRTMLWARAVGEDSPLPGWTESDWEEVCQKAQSWPLQRLADNFRTLVTLGSEIRRAIQPRFVLESALVQMCVDTLAEAQPDGTTASVRTSAGLPGKMPTLESQETTASPGVVTVQGNERMVVAAIPPVPKDTLPGDKPADVLTHVEKRSNPVDLQTVRAKWPLVLEALRRNMPLRAMVVEGQVIEVNDHTLTLAYRRNYRLHKETVEKTENRRKIEEVIASVLSLPLELVVTYRDEPGRETSDPPRADSVLDPPTPAGGPEPAPPVAVVAGEKPNKTRRARGRPNGNHASIGSQPPDPLEKLAEELFDGRVVELLESEQSGDPEGQHSLSDETLGP